MTMAQSISTEAIEKLNQEFLGLMNAPADSERMAPTEILGYLVDLAHQARLIYVRVRMLETEGVT